ncbi:MAG: POTRA domain-containing protein [bacterium]
MSKNLWLALLIILITFAISLMNTKASTEQTLYSPEQQIQQNEIQNQTYDTQQQIYEIEIDKIIIKGNKNIPTSSILEASQLTENSKVTMEQISDAVNRIYETGYFSDIEINFEKSEKNKLNLVIYVLENPIVKTIRFSGNKILSDLDLIELINSRPGKILNYNVIREDIIIINEEYNKMGYIGVKNHVKDIEISPDGILTFHIQEAFYPKEVQILGNKTIATDKLRKLVQIKPNQPLKKQDLENTLNKIYEYYQEEGYMLADIRSEIAELVKIEIYEAILEDIEVQGNTKTKKYVIEKILEVPKGRIIKVNKLRRGIRKLQLGGLFKNVETDFRGGSEPGKVILIVKVEEQQTGQVVLGVGFGGLPGSNRGGLAGSFSVSEINYKGRGQQIFTNWERGALINNISLSFSDPYSLPKDYFYGFNIQSTELFQQRAIVKTDPLTIALYKDYRTNYGFFFGRRLIEKDMSYNINLSFLSFKTSPTPTEEFPEVLQPTKGNYILIGSNLVKDVRDDEFYPSKGTFYSISIDHSIRSTGNLKNFSRISGEYRKYFNFKKERVLAFRIFLGLATSSTPFVYQYTLGGSDTLRGYDFNRFIGTTAFMVNVEYRFPINPKLENFYGAAFIDWGGAFSPSQKINLSKTGLSYGVGIRFILPQFGSIRLDYAISNEKSKVAVGIGQMF